MNWIPTTQELPDADTTVLVFVPGEDPWPGYFDGEAWFSPENLTIGPVTHWMHMPEPPEVAK